MKPDQKTKLVLTKQTVARLNNSGMQTVRAGNNDLGTSIPCIIEQVSRLLSCNGNCQEAN